MYLWNHRFFPKYHRKNLIDFCPGRFYRLSTCDLFWLFTRWLYSGECITYLVWINFQGRNLSIFSVVFWKIDDFINTFWLHLTFRTPNSFTFRKYFTPLCWRLGWQYLTAMLQSYCIAVAADMYVKVFQTMLRKIPNDKISIKLINICQ